MGRVKRSRNSWNLAKPVMLKTNSAPRVFILWVLPSQIIVFLKFVWVGFLSCATKVFWLQHGCTVRTMLGSPWTTNTHQCQEKRRGRHGLLRILSRSWPWISYNIKLKQMLSSYHWLNLTFCFRLSTLYWILWFPHNVFKPITFDFSYSRIKDILLFIGSNTWL